MPIPKDDLAFLRALHHRMQRLSWSLLAALLAATGAMTWLTQAFIDGLTDAGYERAAYWLMVAAITLILGLWGFLIFGGLKHERTRDD